MCDECHQIPCHSRCPNNTGDEYEACNNCCEELVVGEYINEVGFSVGCTECVDENENTGSLQCNCEHFNCDTDKIFTRHGFLIDGQLEVLGCSECLRLRSINL